MSRIACPQSRLDVGHWNPVIEASERARERSGGIALNDNHIWCRILQHWLQCFQNPRRQPAERLVRTHDVQVEIGDYLESFQYLIQHGAVLRGDTDAHGQFPSGLQFPNQRTELDGLGTGAEDK